MRISDWSSDVCSSDLHVTPEQRGAVSGDSGTAAAFLDFLEYCRDNNIQGRLKKGATYYLAPDSFTLGDGQRLDLTSEDFAGAPILPTASANKLGRASCRESVCPYV